MRTIVALLVCGSLWAGERIIHVQAQLTGDFQQRSDVPDPKWTWQIHRTDTTFVCYGASGGCRGGLVTEPFAAPQMLDFYTAGFGQQSAGFLVLERQDDKTTLRLKSRIDPSLAWRLRSWKLGPDWTGHRVRLKVENPGASGPNGWMAISLPMQGEVSIWSFLYGASLRVAWLWIIAILLLVPGTGLALEAHRRFREDSSIIFASALAAAGLASYTGFWIFLRSPMVGKAFAIFVVATGLFFLWRNRHMPAWKPLAWPVLAFALVSSAYCCFDFLYPTDEPPAIATARRFSHHDLPPDNYMPEIVAERLYVGDDLRSKLVAGWQASDRPPLQAAMVDMVRPFTGLIQADLAYELCGIALQCTWVFGIWFLLNRLGFTNRATVPVIGMIFFSGFGFLHSVFVWPKMLAASYLLLGIGLFLPIGKSRPIWGWLCIGLGMLSHSGCGLTLPGLIPLLWIYRSRMPWRRFCMGVLLVTCLFVPWVWFQKIYNPPGDRLLRLSFAGDYLANGSLLDVTIAAYRKLTLKEVLLRRLSDFAALFHADAESPQPTKLGRMIADYTSQTFFCLFVALGLLNLGFLVRFSAFWRRVRDQVGLVFIDRLLLCVALSTAVWIAIMYEASATVIHQGSLANVLLLMAGLTLYIQAIWRRALYALLAAQAVLLFPLFVFSKPILEQQLGVLWTDWMDPGALMVGLASCGGLVYSGWRAVSTPQFPPERARTPLSP